MVLLLSKKRLMGRPTTGTFPKVEWTRSFIRKYRGVERIFAKYFAKLPAFLEMDILLSFKITIIWSPLRAALLMAS